MLISFYYYYHCLVMLTWVPYSRMHSLDRYQDFGNNYRKFSVSPLAISQAASTSNSLTLLILLQIPCWLLSPMLGVKYLFLPQDLLPSRSFSLFCFLSLLLLSTPPRPSPYFSLSAPSSSSIFIFTAEVRGQVGLSITCKLLPNLQKSFAVITAPVTCADTPQP